MPRHEMRMSVLGLMWVLSRTEHRMKVVFMVQVPVRGIPHGTNTLSQDNSLKHFVFLGWKRMQGNAQVWQLLHVVGNLVCVHGSTEGRKCWCNSHKCGDLTD